MSDWASTEIVGSLLPRIAEDCEASCEREAAGEAADAWSGEGAEGAVWATATSGARNTEQASADASLLGRVLKRLDMGERAVVSKAVSPNRVNVRLKCFY
ncbi:hypothetical protein Bpla01_63380 [Burkholderia plantarii]|nr:hypothetical protein Bpla01_63380 [Burkholderia plantarii]